MKNFLFLLKTTRTTDSLRHGRMGEFLAPGDWPFQRLIRITVSPPAEIQAAKVARVSAASGSFEGFRVEGEVADAKSSKLAAVASRPRAKI